MTCWHASTPSRSNARRIGTPCNSASTPKTATVRAAPSAWPRCSRQVCQIMLPPPRDDRATHRRAPDSPAVDRPARAPRVRWDALPTRHHLGSPRSRHDVGAPIGQRDVDHTGSARDGAAVLARSPPRNRRHSVRTFGSACTAHGAQASSEPPFAGEASIQPHRLPFGLHHIVRAAVS